ncbi:hypothetical protein [Trueperella pyogenes]
MKTSADCGGLRLEAIDVFIKNLTIHIECMVASPMCTRLSTYLMSSHAAQRERFAMTPQTPVYTLKRLNIEADE